MLKYRNHATIRAGVIGVLVIMLVIPIGLAPERLIGWATSLRYQALFTDASGLAVGNKVTVSGMPIGRVTGIEFQDPNALVRFTADARTPLGSDTAAHIRTGTLLGERVLALDSAGTGTLRQSDVIPLSRTFTPYSLTDAVGELTSNTAATNTGDVNQALDALSATIDQIAPQLGPTFDGLTRISRVLNDRDESLAALFASGRDVTEILADRSGQISTLILNADALVGTLSDRRQAIVELLSYTSALAQQVSGLVDENTAELAPALEQLNSVLAMLERKRDDIAKALPRLSKFLVTLGETVASGPFYTAYIPNLDLPPLLQPFLDYAFGFRRGVGAGQPPDQAGPRAELPFPRNGIPQRPPR